MVTFRNANALAFALAAWPACQAVDADVALNANLRVADAQFIAGNLGDIDANQPDGPAVVSVFNSLTTVQPGERDKALTGTLEPGATAAALGLRGDRGYWIVGAGPPQLDAPDLPTFQATLSFSAGLPAGDLALLVRAVNAASRFGVSTVVPLVSAPPLPPSGTLVVSLRWDTEADLDLHVITPDGVEVWAGNINSYQPPPPGKPADPTAWRQGGILDFDSNAGCTIDGQRRENVVWEAPAPPGTYQVRVDTPALCDAASARWQVSALVNGASIAAAQGESLPSDTRFSKGVGSGIQALVFDVPAP